MMNKDDVQNKLGEDFQDEYVVADGFAVHAFNEILSGLLIVATSLYTTLYDNHKEVLYGDEDVLRTLRNFDQGIGTLLQIMRKLPPELTNSDTLRNLMLVTTAMTILTKKAPKEEDTQTSETPTTSQSVLSNSKVDGDLKMGDVQQTSYVLQQGKYVMNAGSVQDVQIGDRYGEDIWA